MSRGDSQKCRLFLEGREVPFVSATITSTVGQPITAIIDLIPLHIIKFIRPKTQVQIYVKDTSVFPDHNFYLAFEGEVVGRQLGKAQDSRFFRITALDYSVYWDEAKAYFYNHNFLSGKISDVGHGATPPDTVATAASAAIVKGAATVGSQMITILLAKTNKDLVHGVAEVFKKLNNINLLYKATWDRLRITDRVRIYTSGKLKEFLSSIKMDVFLDSFTGAHGGMVSIRDVLTNVMGAVFHDFISVPFPSRVKNYPKIAGVESPVAVGETLGSFLFVPDAYSLPPPRCNTIFPSQIVSFDFSEDFRSSPTRLMFRGSFPEFLQDTLKISTFSAQYYPTSFSDYMFKSNLASTEEKESLLGASQLLVDSSGKSYADIRFLGSKNTAVGKISVSPQLREADFLTNEESLKGIIFDEETLAPGMTTLVINNKPSSRRQFTQEVGKYLFFKKRFGSRNASANLKFHPFLVPGFNCFLVDDSEANQTVMAKVQSLTHNLTNSGFSTSVSLGYARDFDEVDALTGRVGDPPLPPWFDTSIFGKVDKSAFKEETADLSKYGAIDDTEAKARDKIDNATCFTKISDFFQYILACDAVTNINGKSVDSAKSKLCTTRGAASWLTKTFKMKASDPLARDEFVRKYVYREVPTMADTFYFLGAQPIGKTTIPEEYAMFEASSASSLFDGKEDATILAVRREIIDQYVTALQQKRGFRG